MAQSALERAVHALASHWSVCVETGSSRACEIASSVAACVRVNDWSHAWAWVPDAQSGRGFQALVAVRASRNTMCDAECGFQPSPHRGPMRPRASCHQRRVRACMPVPRQTRSLRDVGNPSTFQLRVLYST